MNQDTTKTKKIALLSIQCSKHLCDLNNDDKKSSSFESIARKIETIDDVFDLKQLLTDEEKSEFHQSIQRTMGNIESELLEFPEESHHFETELRILNQLLTI